MTDLGFETWKFDSTAHSTKKHLHFLTFKKLDAVVCTITLNSSKGIFLKFIFSVFLRTLFLNYRIANF